MARLRLRSRRAVATAVLLLGLSAGPASAASAANRTCYFPDGSVSAGDLPCSSSATDTSTIHCCNTQSACLSTGYCMSAEQPPYVISRGSCTDNAWGSGCPAKCAGTDDDPSGGMPISWLGTTNNGGSPLYCCGALTVVSGKVACANGEDAFVLGTSKMIFGVAILENTTTTTSSSTSSSSSSSSSSTSLSSSTSAPRPSSSTSSDSSSADSASKVTAVGAGVGVSLGVVAAAFAAWALWERRKRRQQLQAFMSGKLPPGMVMNHAYPGHPGNLAGGDTIHPGNSGTPFSPSNVTSTGTVASTFPGTGGGGGGGGGGMYATAAGNDSNNGSKQYTDSQPLVELSAYPRQFEELPSHEHR